MAMSKQTQAVIQSAVGAPNSESNILINFGVSFVSPGIQMQRNVTPLGPSRLNMRCSFEFSVTTSEAEEKGGYMCCFCD